MGVVHALNSIALQTIAHGVGSYNKISAWLTNTGAIQSSGAGSTVIQKCFAKTKALTPARRAERQKVQVRLHQGKSLIKCSMNKT